MKVSQDPLKGPSIGLMHMMAVKGKQRLLAHGSAVSCTQTNGLWGNKECLFSVLQDWSKGQQKQTKKANTHTQRQTENLCQMKTNDGTGNNVINRALQSSLEYTSLSVVLPLQFYCQYHHAVLMQASTQVETETFHCLHSLWKWRWNVLWCCHKNNFITYVNKYIYIHFTIITIKII